MSLFDVDPQRSASHRNMAVHLAGPLRDGAVETPLPLTLVDGAWCAQVDWVSRQPVLLVELRGPLAEAGLSVTLNVQFEGSPEQTATLGLATARAGFSPFTDLGSLLDDVVGPPAADTLGLATARAGLAPFTEFGSILDDVPLRAANLPPTATLWFAPFSDAGTVLPAWPPTPAGEVVLPFSIVVGNLSDGTAVDARVGLRLVEGNLGRLLYVIGAEKARLRRQARELYELRRLRFPFDDASPDHRRMANALDRLGADLGVPRRSDRLSWDPVNQQVTSENVPEPNEAYRQRLALYRPFVRPTPRRVESMLRVGAGAELATITESNTVHAIAVRLVSSPDDAPRLAFLDWVRSTHLLQPGQPVPATRLLPNATRIAQNQALARVATAFQFPTGSFVAPLLIELLDLVGRCRAALGITRPWQVLRAQDSAGGSRYELGLGVELERPPASELDALARTQVRGGTAAGTDVATQQLLGSLTAASSTADPLGRWLLAGCGAMTVHATATGIFVSHAAMFGAVLTSAAPNQFEARFEAPTDPGQDAVLWYGLRDAAADAAALGLPAWTELSGSAASAARGGAIMPSAAFRDVLASLRITMPATSGELARTIAELAAVPSELFTTLRLDGVLAAGLLAGNSAARLMLKQLVGFFTARELGSVLPLVTTSSVLLVVGAQLLPGASVLVDTERLAFRWHAVPITGSTGKPSLKAGPRNTYTPPDATPSLVALVAVSLARVDRDDPRDRIPPYTARVRLPAGVLIDLSTYERVMNLLERVVPIGVVLDTKRVREAHVDPGQVRHPVPLTGRLARSFRQFQLDHRFAMVTDDPAQ